MEVNNVIYCYSKLINIAVEKCIARFSLIQQYISSSFKVPFGDELRFFVRHYHNKSFIIKFHDSIDVIQIKLQVGQK